MLRRQLVAWSFDDISDNIELELECGCGQCYIGRIFWVLSAIGIKLKKSWSLSGGFSHATTTD